MKLKFFPDKPFERNPEDLDGWDASNNYICQQKVDGWRMVIILTETGVEFVSRHNTLMTADIELHLKEECSKLKETFPVGTQIDSEWISRRSCSKQYNLKPQLYVFDLIRLGAKWMHQTPYLERYTELCERLKPLGLEFVTLPVEAAPGHFSEFYEAQKSLLFSEGVVVKHKKSLLIADRKESKKNPQWFKVKYRAGNDGEMDMSHLRTKKSRA